MEALPEFVNRMVSVPLDHGLENPLHAIVSTITCIQLLKSIIILITIVIHCEPLLLENGTTLYTKESLEYGTVATHSCDKGFSLSGIAQRMCNGDETSITGTWSGIAPTCKRKEVTHIYRYIVASFYPQPLLVAPYTLRMEQSHLMIRNFLTILVLWPLSSVMKDSL